MKQKPLSMSGRKNLDSVDEYIASFPAKVQAMLQQVRKTIHVVIPTAEETIKYGMPTVVHCGNLVYYAAFKNHIGLFGIPSGIAPFKKKLTPYVVGKGSVQLPYSDPLPINLITEMVSHRVKENETKSLEKSRRVCKNGHTFYKTTACPTCPRCEQESKPAIGFLSQLSAPARRALEAKEIKTLNKLATFTEAEILQLHGIGKTSIPKLKTALASAGLSFK